MSYPPPPGGWHDPSGAGPQSSPPVDPTLPMAGNPIPTQPTSADPYAPVDPYAAPGYPPPATPYAVPGYPPPGDPYAAAGHAPAYPGYAPPSSKTNTLAIVALVLSLVGFTSCITAPVGAIMGHVARKQIRQTGEQGEGMAKAAIIVGWILTALLVLLIIFYVVMIVIAINSDSSSTY
ncbi:DUF4190 domain-containing protein [Micromonospora terminaliae]|uniref:DUF4190 domain-containing protein n=1 Tax=Micromonospora terminaliae TaxID=1914461 RepID=A0AAJ3DK22_9ACTN|nr:DUF4190 domain-containing protein [Micromonospora terminaliae]NES26510.1 DUF4190 domain-containing protein [Micromonospora terminaliae]QGL50683.1 DUF4190 domain-containing protein [Micromonospora terminaliae]